MSIVILDANRAPQTVATIDDLLTLLGAAALGVKPQKVAGQTTWTKGTLTLDGTSQPLVGANSGRCGLVVQSRFGNQPIDLDPAGGTVAAGEGWLVLGGDPPVCLLGAECPVGVVTVIGTSGDIVTFWEIT